MPTYVYRCQSCQHVFERVHSMSAAGPTDCQACHKPTLQKLITGSQFILKGKGWYHDGYGSQTPSKKGEE